MTTPKAGNFENNAFQEQIKDQERLRFENVEITPEQPYEFPIHLEKCPIEVNDGDRLGDNCIEVNFDQELTALMDEAAELKGLPEKERIVALLDLVRAKLKYPYPEVIEAAKREDPDLGKWLDYNFGKRARVDMDVSECLRHGYGDCKIASAAYLAAGKTAGLNGIVGGGNVKNIERPGTKDLIFKSSEYTLDQEVGHSWVEVQTSDGNWIPVDISANMVASDPEMLEFFRRANYRIPFGTNIEGLPENLEGGLKNSYFEPGQKEGDFTASIKIKTKQINPPRLQYGPLVDRFQGELEPSIADGHDAYNKRLYLTMKKDG